MNKVEEILKKHNIYTIDAAAKMAGVSYNTMKARVQRGKYKIISLGSGKRKFIFVILDKNEQNKN